MVPLLMVEVRASETLAVYPLKPSMTRARTLGQIMSQVIHPHRAPRKIPRIVIPRVVMEPMGGINRKRAISRTTMALFK